MEQKIDQCNGEKEAEDLRPQTTSSCAPQEVLEQVVDLHAILAWHQKKKWLEEQAKKENKADAMQISQSACSLLEPEPTVEPPFITPPMSPRRSQQVGG